MLSQKKKGDMDKTLKQECEKIAWTAVIQWATLNMPDSVTAIKRLSSEIYKVATMTVRTQAAEFALKEMTKDRNL